MRAVQPSGVFRHHNLPRGAIVRHGGPWQFRVAVARQRDVLGKPHKHGRRGVEDGHQVGGLTDVAARIRRRGLTLKHPGLGAFRLQEKVGNVQRQIGIGCAIVRHHNLRVRFRLCTVELDMAWHAERGGLQVSNLHGLGGRGVVPASVGRHEGAQHGVIGGAISVCHLSGQLHHRHLAFASVKRDRALVHQGFIASKLHGFRRGQGRGGVVHDFDGVQVLGGVPTCVAGDVAGQDADFLRACAGHHVHRAVQHPTRAVVHGHGA